MPEPQLPPLPPGSSGGGAGDGGSGSGGGGGHHPGYAKGPSHPSTEYGSNAFTSDYFAAGNAYVRNVIACRAAAAKRGQTPVHPSRFTKRPSREAILRSRRNTHRPGTILQLLLREPASLADSLAKLSLGGGRPAPVQQQASAHAVHAQPAQPKHTTGVGGGVVKPRVASVQPPPGLLARPRSYWHPRVTSLQPQPGLMTWPRNRPPLVLVRWLLLPTLAQGQQPRLAKKEALVTTEMVVVVSKPSR
jgi:hypothetical protein